MYIKVKVVPCAKKESLEKVSEDTFAIKVKEPAERNLANKRVVEIIAGEFAVRAGKVRIVSGYRSRSKILAVEID